MKNLIKIAVILAVIGALLIPAMAKAADPVESSEIVSLRAENSKTFDMGYGKRQQVVSIGAIHYKDNYANKYESWKDIDLTWNVNYIGKAPYELWVEGNKITIRDKRTGAVSTVELLEIGRDFITPQAWEYSEGVARIRNVALDTDLEIVAESSRVRFSRVLKSAEAPIGAKFMLIAYMPFTFGASDREGDIPVETSLKDGILTETLKPNRVVKYPARIDPTWQVGVSSDDVFRRLTPSYWSRTVSMRAGAYSDTITQYGCAMRFTNIAIPAGSTIDEVYFTFRCLTRYTGTACNSRVSAEDVDDAPTFADDSGAFDTRWANRTTARMDYDNIPAETEGEYFNSPTTDGSTTFASVIQEVIDRGGWASGQDIVIFWEDFEDRSTHTGVSLRENYSYDNDSGSAPALVISFTEPSVDPPTVTTQAASSVEDITATGHGNITDTGGEDCDYRGIAWDTTSRSDPGALSPAASAYTNYNSEGPGSYGTGAFTRNLTSLDTGTTHYARAYAHNSGGWNWGTEVSFLTKPVAPTSVAATDGTYGDKVVVTWTKATGATGYQIYRDATPLGWLGDVETGDDAGAGAPTITAGSTVATDGTQTAHVALSLSGTSLNSGTTHTYKVRAKNATGESVDSSTNTGYRRGTLTYQWQKSDGDADSGYSPIGGATSSTYNDTAAPAGTISNAGTVTASDGTSPDHVTLSLASEATTDGTGRYYKCDLAATGVAGQTSANNRGYRSVGSITYQWQRSAVDSDASYSNIEGATTDPYNDTGAPESGDGRYYQCITSSVDASNSPQTSDSDRGYRAAVPVVTTQAATNIEDTTATGNGNITDTGNGNCSAWGICWNLGGNPTTADNVVAGSGDGSTGAFTASLTGLPTGTTIHTKAYATNVEGTGYGAEEDFLTKPAAPTNVAATDGDHTDKVVVTWTKSTGATGYKVYEGANLLDTLGDVATYDDEAAPAGTIDNSGNVTASDGTESAYVTLSLANESTTAGAPRTYKVVALNATGDSDDSATNDGNRGAGTITYQWQRSAADSDADYGNIGGATTDPYNDTGAPAGAITAGNVTATDGDFTGYVTLSLANESIVDGAGRHFQCVLSSVDASNSPQTSDNSRGYRGTGVLNYQWQMSDADSDADYNTNVGTTDPRNATEAPAGIITAGTTVASDGSSRVQVELYLTGESLAEGTGRYFQCELWATGTDNATSDNDRGYRTTGILTYQWQRSAGDSDDDYGNITGATTEAYNDTAAPPPTITPGNAVATDGDHTDKIALSLSGTTSNDGAGRYYVCILDATGTTQQTSATNRGHTDSGSLSYQWQRSSGDSDDDYSNLDGATSDSYNDTDAPAGIVTPGTASASDGTEAAHVVLALAGESKADGAGRYYVCVLTAPDAAGQTAGNNRGYRTTGELALQWQRSAADSDTDYSNIGGATTDPYNDTGAPSNGSRRYFQCIVSSVGASNSPQTSNSDRGYRAASLMIITLPCTGYDKLWAIVNGEITQGTDPVTKAGFEYGLSDSYGDNQTLVGDWDSWEDNEFWAKLLNLSPATSFHYRAMAYDGSWAYGEDRVFSTKGSPAPYEHLNTGGDGDSGAIFSANWTAEQFTSDNVSHTATSIRVPLKRVGTYPGNVELLLTYADSDNFSTGATLSFDILNGNAISTSYVWYDFDIPDITIDENTSYAIVVRATSGNSTDYILWQKDAGGALDNAVGSHTSDSGVSWVSDSPTDYLFEIWGETVISVERVAVFSGYIDTGDWLIVLTYKNAYAPYYPNDDPKAYFYIQLIDDTTVKAQVNCPMWSYKPGSIYINKALADTLEWGSPDYKVRLYGDFGTNPATDYALAALDWRGAELTLLDSWIITQANAIGDEDNEEYTMVLEEGSEVLNAEGSAIFTAGISGLRAHRPDVFAVVMTEPPYTGDTDWTHALQATITHWETQWGPDVALALNSVGAIFGDLDGQVVGGFGFGLICIVLIAAGAAAGHITIGLVFGYIPILAGFATGLIGYALMGVITFLMFAIWVFKTFMTK